MKPGRRRLNRGHFRLFKDECGRLVGLLGLNDWRIEYKFGKLDKYCDDEDGIIHGMCDSETGSRSALITLGREVVTESALEDEVLDTARHEMMELLLSDLVSAAMDREWDDKGFEAIKHSVICRLTNMLEKIK